MGGGLIQGTLQDMCGWVCVCVFVCVCVGVCVCVSEEHRLSPCQVDYKNLQNQWAYYGFTDIKAPIVKFYNPDVIAQTLRVEHFTTGTWRTDTLNMCEVEIASEYKLCVIINVVVSENKNHSTFYLHHKVIEGIVFTCVSLSVCLSVCVSVCHTNLVTTITQRVIDQF